MPPFAWRNVIQVIYPESIMCRFHHFEIHVDHNSILPYVMSYQEFPALIGFFYLGKIPVEKVGRIRWDLRSRVRRQSKSKPRLSTDHDRFFKRLL